ncbi:MAG: TRAP transporter substrate-binding protein DctP [Clostridiales Family XIII bacterium]|nr:TRAP transporter substrate-binding protein DctP [Clostridiales Family XIII bacterium]
MKKKRIAILALALACAMSLGACGGGSGGNSDGSAAGDGDGGAAGTDSAAPAYVNPYPDNPYYTDETLGTLDPDAASFKKLNLSFATYLPEDNINKYQIQAIEAKCNARMGADTITITTYPNGTLLQSADIFDGVVSGTADLGYVQVGAMTGRMPLVGLLETPGLAYTGPESDTSVIREYIETLHPEELQGVEVLLPLSGGLGGFFVNKEIQSVADMKGLQIRCSALAGEAIKAWGATPVSLDPGEVYEAMRNGLIDGMWTMAGATTTYKFDEIADYAYINPFYNQAYMIVANKGIYDRMAARQAEIFREVIDEVWNEVSLWYQIGFDYDEVAQQSFSKMKHVEFMTDALQAEFAAPIRPIVESYAANLDKQGLDGAGALALADSLIAKYNAEYPLDDAAKDRILKWVKN